MIVYKDIEQRSPEWDAIRRCVLTASNFKKVITSTGKLADPIASRKFIRDLVIECFVDHDPHKEAAEKRASYDFSIRWGNDHENVARKWFQDNVAPVSEVGFVKLGEHIPVGCSPDGLVPIGGNSKGWYSGLEIKCPALSTHIGYLEKQELPDEYKLQVHGSMAVTGLKSWYFLSYYPDEKIRPFLLEVERDDFTEKVADSLAEFVKVYKAEFGRLSLVIDPESEVAA